MKKYNNDLKEELKINFSTNAKIIYEIIRNNNISNHLSIILLDEKDSKETDEFFIKLTKINE